MIPEPSAPFISLRTWSTVNHDQLLWLSSNIYTDTESGSLNRSSKTLVGTRARDTKTLLMGCSVSMAGTGVRRFSLREQSWVCPDTSHCASLLRSSGSGRGQNGCPLRWPVLSRATCHPERVACFVGRVSGQWENGREFRDESETTQVQRKWAGDQRTW